MKTFRAVQAAPDTKSAARNVGRFDVVDLGPFENNQNDVLALNDRAQCAGVSFNPKTSRREAFQQSEGNRTMLGTLGGSFSIARGINNQGEIVGGSLTKGDEKFHGFIYTNNRLQDLNELLDPSAGWELVQALGINNHGEIIAIGCYTGHDRIVLLRPRI